MIQSENGTQSKVVSRKTRMSRVIRILIWETGEGRVRESRGWSTKGLGWSRSQRQSWVEIKQIKTNINGKWTGRLETNKQVNKTRLWRFKQDETMTRLQILKSHGNRLERLWIHKYDLANKTGWREVLCGRKQGLTDYVQVQLLRWWGIHEVG